MTKLKKTRQTRKQSKAPAHRGKRQANLVSNILKDMDEEQVAMLEQIVLREMGFGTDMFGPEDVVDLFAEYLESCARGNVDEDAKGELLVELVNELSGLRVSSNGGDQEARGKIQAILDLVDNANENRSINPVDMMIMGKIFADAGWTVPDSLKNAMAEALESAPPGTQDIAGGHILSSLLEVADQARQNPFDVHEYLNSLLASLPTQASVMLLHELIAGKKAVINHAVAGFVLHRDAVLAQSAVEALAASARQTPVENSLIERLVRMRPWLPQSRQVQLDAKLRAMRLNALPPVKVDSPKVIRCYVSVCDGTGTRSLFVTQKAGSHYQVVTVMMGLAGVVDAMVLPKLSKSSVDDLVRQLKSTMLMVETDLAGISRMLGLAIADNFASEIPPPFKLVEVMESLGLGPVHPDYTSSMEIIAGLLADLPPEHMDPTAMAKAHADILDSEFKYQWYEAGEALKDLLYPVKGSKQRAAKLIKSYLPERRHFWVRQCAISALALRGDKKTHHSSWQQLALVGRDIASDLPLDQIPFMKQVAKISVRAFEDRM